MLFSGGLDSAVLVAMAAQDGPVQPLYVSVGLAWEPAERDVAARKGSFEDLTNAVLHCGGGAVLDVVRQEHHAIGDNVDWPWWYEEVVGGRYLFDEVNGKKSSYLHDVAQLLWTKR